MEREEGKTFTMTNEQIDNSQLDKRTKKESHEIKGKKDWTISLMVFTSNANYNKKVRLV
jgi:hypothetical protein